MWQPRVAVDAMGGDHGPAVAVEGARLASQLGLRVCLAGPEALLPLHRTALPHGRAFGMHGPH